MIHPRKVLPFDSAENINSLRVWGRNGQIQPCLSNSCLPPNKAAEKGSCEYLWGQLALGVSQARHSTYLVCFFVPRMNKGAVSQRLASRIVLAVVFRIHLICKHLAGDIVELHAKQTFSCLFPLIKLLLKGQLATCLAQNNSFNLWPVATELLLDCPS